MKSADINGGFGLLLQAMGGPALFMSLLQRESQALRLQGIRVLALLLGAISADRERLTSPDASGKGFMLPPVVLLFFALLSFGTLATVAFPHRFRHPPQQNLLAVPPPYFGVSGGPHAGHQRRRFEYPPFSDLVMFSPFF